MRKEMSTSNFFSTMVQAQWDHPIQSKVLGFEEEVVLIVPNHIVACDKAIDYRHPIS
jgi:hypothetical protein